GEAGFVAQALVLLADDVKAQVVEGGDGQAPAFGAAQQHADALLHLPGGLVGEGHGDDVLGTDAALLDQIGDLAGDDTGLAATGAGQHEQGAADIAHSFMYTGVELRLVDLEQGWARNSSIGYSLRCA